MSGWLWFVSDHDVSFVVEFLKIVYRLNVKSQAQTCSACARVVHEIFRLHVFFFFFFFSFLDEYF